MSFGASAQAIAHIRSYEEAEAFLAAKGVDSRRVCGDNTYVERRGDDIAIRLHQTDILTFLKSASPVIVLNTDGWHTLITRQRLEQFLPAPLTVYSFKGQWRVGLKDGQRWATTKADNTHSVVFTDGLKLIWNTVGWEPLNALTPDAALEHYADLAKEVLQVPEDFGYFGGDFNLWKFSAPTFTKHRDSDNIEVANFDIVWETLKTEFPDLFHEELDEEGYAPRDFATWPAIYVFGAGHWAVGHIDQIVVPVVQDRERPVGPTNLHPAFIRVSELAEQTKLYPALPGAEERAAVMDVEQELADIKSTLHYLENSKDWPVGWLTEHDISTAIVQDLGEEYDWSPSQVERAVVALSERFAHDENNASLPGQGVLI